MSKNYYEILGVSPGASLDEIKAAYRIKAYECHPDRAAINNLTVEESTVKFQELGEAFEKLKEEIEKSNVSPNPSNPDYWTEPISPEERKKASEETILLIEAKFASSGVTANDLDKSEIPMLFFYLDWRDMMRRCFDRREFNVKYNQMLVAIERAASRKKNKDFQTDDKNQEKATKRGFSTKEKVDEYDGRKKAEDEALNEKNFRTSGDDRKGESNSFQPKSEINSPSTNDQKNNPVDDLNSKPDFKEPTKADANNSNKNISQGKEGDTSNINYLSSSLPEKYQEEQKEFLEDLKKQLSQLQKQQNVLQNTVKEQSTSQQPKPSFPWLIPMGAIILVFGMIILLLLGKRKS